MKSLTLATFATILMMASFSQAETYAELSRQYELECTEKLQKDIPISNLDRASDLIIADLELEAEETLTPETNATAEDYIKYMLMALPSNVTPAQLRRHFNISTNTAYKIAELKKPQYEDTQVILTGGSSGEKNWDYSTPLWMSEKCMDLRTRKLQAMMRELDRYPHGEHLLLQKKLFPKSLKNLKMRDLLLQKNSDEGVDSATE